MKSRQGDRTAVALFVFHGSALRSVLIGVLLLMAGPGAARSGLLLSWSDCPYGVTATSGHISDCASNAGSVSLFCAVRVPATIDSVLGLELIVDLQSQSATLPDWWQLGLSGCRSDDVIADDTFPLETCGRPWNVKASGGVLDYMPGMPRSSPNQARMVIALAVPPGDAGRLVADSTYYAARIVMSYVRTTGASSCAGCLEPMCLIFNSILVRRPPRPIGAPSADVFIEGADSPSSNRVTWQGSGGSLCDAVPVRRSTWGAIKSLYR